ncbi:SID1 transmembrane family member 1-like [Cloeon dipterum]|uniref:SID1 transmembrane family member 1-like n=1 Tax=Cloeon dipterum TaxID=197152 RepID=UPI0032207B59
MEKILKEQKMQHAAMRGRHEDSGLVEQSDDTPRRRTTIEPQFTIGSNDHSAPPPLKVVPGTLGQYYEQWIDQNHTMIVNYNTSKCPISHVTRSFNMIGDFKQNIAIEKSIDWMRMSRSRNLNINNINRDIEDEKWFKRYSILSSWTGSKTSNEITTKITIQRQESCKSVDGFLTTEEPSSGYCNPSEDSSTDTPGRFIWIIVFMFLYGVPFSLTIAMYNLDINNFDYLDTRCYYNFHCAHPKLRIIDFNHVVSNAGYCILGVIFVLIVKLLHRESNVNGVQLQSSLYYAMGMSLFAEGFFSACYHTCPNRYSFQIDTIYMYVMAVLCMLAIYQKRRADITRQERKWIYSFLSFICVSSWLGVLLDTKIWFWPVFSVMHFSCTIFLAFNCKINSSNLNCKRYKKESSSWYRRGTILFFFLFNLTFDIVVNILRPQVCTSVLLYLLILNLAYGSGVYITLKIVKDTEICTMKRSPWKSKCFWFIVATCVCLALSTGFFALGISYYLQTSNNWESPPAISRTLNKQCVLFGFFDNHDIWHFLSAPGLFFYFLFLFIIDRHLDDVPSDQISALF